MLHNSDLLLQQSRWLQDLDGRLQNVDCWTWMGCWICCARIQVQDLQHPGPSATLPGLDATYCSRTWICCSSTRVCLSRISIYCSIYIGTPGHGRIAPDPGSSPAPGPGCCEWRSLSATTSLSDAAGPQRPPPPPVLGPRRRSCAAPWCVSFTTIHRSTVPVLGPRPSRPVSGPVLPSGVSVSPYTAQCQYSVLVQVRQSSRLHLLQFIRQTTITSYLIFSRPRSEGWPHYGRTFSIYRCPLSF